EDALLVDLVAPCRDSSNRKLLADLIGQVELFRREVENLSTTTTDIVALLDVANGEKLLHALERLPLQNCNVYPITDVRALWDKTVAAAKLLPEAHFSFQAFINNIGCEVVSFGQANAALLLATVRLIE